MAEKTFALNTEPHVAVIGDQRFEFLPEVVGAEFAGSYAKLKDMRDRVRAPKGAKAKADAADIVDAELLASLSESMRSFIRGFLLPASAEAFDKARLPDRILVELIEWVAALYGGGSGNDQAGQSTDS